MTSSRLATLSQHMTVFTLLLIVGMLLLNAILWFYPGLGADDGLGIAFALSEVMISLYTITIEMFPWWQTLGAILLSCIPLLALASGLNHLRRLFQGYARGEYFSSTAAMHLGKVGRDVVLWVGASFVCTPRLSAWVTMFAPPGERFLTISFTTADFVALFLAACISVIARVLLLVSVIDSKNSTFV
ncbi:DUF2975 domain-containing protein [Pseudomonas sp. TH31]|uniref:DUF2975 domain-containing protein n=1 Tax=Pseudomonas sp. TH31 TaxID=2796396 RepID=UPI001914085E|nr:DUF2975 domain-containing protein [Pseudomonas sp. TH31]MBK5415381.1 DUF2975 domain-containing protein [Pseudomonas sp. TH31]